jgi:hypothetical protein
MGLGDKILGGIFKGAVNLTENVGKTAMNLGEYAYRYTVGGSAVLREFEPMAKQGFGKTITNVAEFLGKGGIRATGAAARVATGVAGSLTEAVPKAAMEGVGAGIGLSNYVGQRVIGAADTVGNIMLGPKIGKFQLPGIFKNDMRDGELVRGFNNLWTGKKMRPTIGVGLMVGAAGVGFASGVKESDESGQMGPITQSEMPSQAYDGNSYNQFAQSATGDLALSLHKLRRG